MAKLTIEPRRWYSTAEAGRVLGISGRRVQQLCEGGRLGERHGRNWAIRGSQLARFADIPRPTGRPVKRKGSGS